MKEVSFEEAMSELDNIVQKLENNQLSLDESISMYQKGIELSNYCSKKLDQAERKITMLVQDKEGNISETPFLGEEE